MPRQNTGSVFLRKDGLWTAQVTRNGKRITEYAATQSEAEQLRQKLLADTTQGKALPDRAVSQPAPIVPTVLTLENVMTRFIAVSNFKPATANVTKLQFNCYLKPYLGAIPLTDIKPVDVVSLLAALNDRGLAASSIRQIHSRLKAILNAALTWELISSNPAAKVKPPKPTYTDKKFWTIEQTKQYINYSLSNPFMWEPFFLLALATGLRESELAGLKWEDIDFSRKTLKVQRSTVQISHKSFATSVPKTRSSLRTIALSKEAFQALDLWEPDTAKRSGAVFQTRKGTPPKRDCLLTSLKQSCQRAGVPYLTVHGLRHQHASLLAVAGVSVKAAQTRLGHANPLMTLAIYQHVLEDADNTTAAALENLLAKEGK